jgi:hypothetical protein
LVVFAAELPLCAFATPDPALVVLYSHFAAWSHSFSDTNPQVLVYIVDLISKTTFEHEDDDEDEDERSDGRK